MGPDTIELVIEPAWRGPWSLEEVTRPVRPGISPASAYSPTRSSADRRGTMVEAMRSPVAAANVKPADLRANPHGPEPVDGLRLDEVLFWRPR